MVAVPGVVGEITVLASGLWSGEGKACAEGLLAEGLLGQDCLAGLVEREEVEF